MAVTICTTGEVAQKLAPVGDVSQQILEAFASDDYRDNGLTLLEVSERVGLGRLERKIF